MKEAGPPESQRGRIERMGVLSLVGRVLFASIFLLSAYHEDSEFGSDGGPAAKYLEPKFNVFVKQVSTSTGMAVPHVEIKSVILATMYIRVFGGLMFILYSSVGAFLLLVYLVFITPVVYDFYHYKMESPQFVQLFTQFSQNLALCGALVFFLGMKSSIPRRYSKRRIVKSKTT
ncbi:uncharacterized protein LOC124665903 [Lolium rigidum]|uniref:uncharacterized protein LOC124665335 n=1 Tax=Lolium rigidum TaxID=89674 RepID=UPI001F5D6CC4|nr:uncharacterized protein LOC124665335 [Lolium rigidum]XP_047059214.1 uncharacterized protein LOC124665903 [Lolium rigidum]